MTEPSPRAAEPLRAGPLSPEQTGEFEERGYLILPAVFSDEELEEMRREADRLLELAINSSLATSEWNVRIEAKQKDGRIDFRKMQPINDLSDVLRAASEDERLIGPLRQLMGDEPVLMEEKLNYKQVIDCPEFLRRFEVREGDNRFPLHHDWGYYRQQGYPTETLSSAICLDVCTHENGPLRVIPGTHRRDDWPLKYPDVSAGNGEVQEGLFADNDRVDCVAPAGSVFLFHALLLHDSKPNTTGRPRRLMIYSHYPARYAMPEDIRNGRTRTAAHRIEDAYRKLVSSGEYTDAFRANSSGS